MSAPNEPQAGPSLVAPALFQPMSPGPTGTALAQSLLRGSFPPLPVVRQPRLLRWPTIWPTVLVSFENVKRLMLVMNGFIVLTVLPLPEQVQCEADQLWPDSCAERSVALIRLL